MARFSRFEVLTQLYAQRMVPIHYEPTFETIRDIVVACYAGGTRVFEYTNRGDFAHEVFGALRRYVNEKMPDLKLGIGSIADAGTCALYLQLGADFVVSSTFQEEVARLCNRRKILYIPGCSTATEIARAEEWGCEIIKIFPAQCLGPAFIKAVKGPSPWSCLMPTGGIELTEASFRSWFEAGAVSIGLNTVLMTPDVIQSKNWAVLSDRIAFALETIQKIMNPHHP